MIEPTHRIAQYQVAAQIGAGGMGQVFRARDTRLSREVAIKVLPKEFASDSDRLRRFEQESKTLAALNHPNVLTIYDADVYEGAPYLVSELLEGRTLREELSSGALQVRKAADYAVQIAQGLAAAHGKGIIHRDLKPENIFVTKDSRVKILDFGLAKLLEAPHSASRTPHSLADPELPTLVESTEPGKIMGTPAYMSPEQVRGEAADSRSDIFAFGCVLYEMLSGTRAFRRDTPIESMHAVLKEEAPDLGARNPNIPPALERVIRRCLEKQPDNRFQSARDLAFALSEVSSSHLPGPGLLLSGRARRLAEAWKWAVTLIALALVLLFAFWQPWKKVASSPAAPTSRANSAAAESRDPLSRAREICVKGSDASRDELKLGISFCQSVIDRDRSNAEAWALMARLSCILYDEYDRTPELLNAAQSAAQNALTLAPFSIAARLAQASVYALQNATHSQSLEILRQLQRDAPNDPDVLVALGESLLFSGGSREPANEADNAEALKLFSRALTSRPGDPMALNYKAWALRLAAGKEDEADAVWNESIHRTGSASALVARLYDLANNRGQAEEAKALIAQLPPDLVFNDHAVRVVTFFWLGQHEPAKTLAFIQPFPRDFVEDHYVELPKGYLVGKAYEQAGDLAAARLEWRKALEAVNRRLALDPEKPRLINCKARLQYLLGEVDEAAKQAEIYQQLTKLDHSYTVILETLMMLMEMGRVHDAVSLLEHNPKTLHVDFLRHYAALFPAVNSAPEFQAELAKIEAETGPAEKRQPSDSRTGSTSPANTNSVAVLPFISLSADKADDYLSDGMTEELLNSLSRVKGLRVPGRSSSFAFKGKAEEDLFRKVGEQLHVGSVLEGSVRKANNQLRVTARLIKVADGFPVWSEEYDRDMTNIFAIQSDIAGRVAQALKVQLLSAGTQPSKPTKNIDAYKLYLQGRQLWNQRTGPAILQAVGCFERAISEDPTYALAHAGLADCYAILNEYAGLPTRETMPKTEATARKAIELDQQLAEPHATLGVIRGDQWDWDGAEAEFRRALELNPNYATAHQWYGLLLRTQSRFPEAVAQLRRARELDPLSRVFSTALAENLFLAGDETQAVEVLQQQLAFTPDFALAHEMLGEIWLMQGKLFEGIRELEAARRLTPDLPETLGRLGFAYARAGRAGDAEHVLAQVLDLQNHGRQVETMIALIYHGLGKDEEALKWLAQALESHSGEDEINYLPLWKDLRPNPRFQGFLHKMHLVK